MKGNKKVVIGIIVVVLLIGVITLSYAFLSVGGKQELGNTFQSGCLNIRIDSESNAISLNNAKPVTDVEGLSTEGYTFTVKNTCSTSADFIINIENIDRQENSLNSDYLKVAINGEEFDNIVSILSSNITATPSVSNAYEAYTIYTGSIEGNATRTFKIREWLDYDATKEQAASKVIKNKINVIAKSDVEVINTLEVKHIYDGNVIVGKIKGNVTTATYCFSEDKICNPSTAIDISNNEITITNKMLQKNEIVNTALGDIEVNIGSKQIICTKLDNEKVECSDLIVTGEPSLNKTSCTPGTNRKYNSSTKDYDIISDCQENTNGIYSSKDDYGVTYYWRGSVDNNYVRFANKWWRIVRINGDGTIRIIYDGETARTNGSTLEVDTSAFNLTTTDNMYVGFKYTSGQAQGIGTKSNVLTQLETWYTNNLSSYASKLDTNAGFCGDRRRNTTMGAAPNGTGGTGTTTTYYGAYYRLRTFKNPELTCDTADLYTVTEATKGNKSLIYPIGLISSDEAAMSGGNSTSEVNFGYYLYTGQIYWTISPYSFNGNAVVGIVNSIGQLVFLDVRRELGVRPVINLKADTIFTGTGTMSDPYVVV